MRARIRIATIPPVPKIVKASIGSQPFSDSRSTRKLQRRRGCLPTGLRPRTTAGKRGVGYLRLRPKHHACTNGTKSTLAPSTPAGIKCQPRSRPPLTTHEEPKNTWNGRRQLRRLHPRIMRSAAPRSLRLYQSLISHEKTDTRRRPASALNGERQWQLAVLCRSRRLTRVSRSERVPLWHTASAP